MSLQRTAAVAAALASVALALLGCGSEPPEMAIPASRIAHVHTAAHAYAGPDAHTNPDRNIRAGGEGSPNGSSDADARRCAHRTTGANSAAGAHRHAIADEYSDA